MGEEIVCRLACQRVAVCLAPGQWLRPIARRPLSQLRDARSPETRHYLVIVFGSVSSRMGTELWLEG